MCLSSIESVGEPGRSRPIGTGLGAVEEDRPAISRDIAVCECRAPAQQTNRAGFAILLLYSPYLIRRGCLRGIDQAVSISRQIVTYEPIQAGHDRDRVPRFQPAPFDIDGNP